VTILSDPMRQRLARGDVLLRLCNHYPTTAVLKSMCAGWDFVWIDMQHGQHDYASSLAAIRTTQAMGLAAMLRVDTHDPLLLGKYADTGATAVLIPMVNTSQQAETPLRRGPHGSSGVDSGGGTRCGGRRRGSIRRHSMLMSPQMQKATRNRQKHSGGCAPIKALRLPAAHPAALRFLRLAVPQLALALFAPRRTSAPLRPGVGDPVAPAGMLPRKRQDLPSSWKTPIVRLHMFHTDAGRTAGTRPLQCRGVALVHRTAKAPAKGLSALNFMAFGLAVYASQCGLPRPSQDSLPAAGQSPPDGLSTRKVPLKGFRSAIYITSSFPKLSWRNR